MAVSLNISYLSTLGRHGHRHIIQQTRVNIIMQEEKVLGKKV